VGAVAASGQARARVSGTTEGPAHEGQRLRPRADCDEDEDEECVQKKLDKRRSPPENTMASTSHTAATARAGRSRPRRSASVAIVAATATGKKAT
jgi:hypothetical protein